MGGSAAWRRAWSDVKQYVGAAVLTCLVVAARLALDPWWGRMHNRHLLFIPTVMVATWLFGFGPGLLALALSTFALDFFWMHPSHGLVRPNSDLILFVLIGAAVCRLVVSLREARARAEAATRSRERLLEVVAHDLRNPLAVVKTTASLLLRDDAQPAEWRRRLAIIGRTVERMERLIGDLVDMTRIEHGELRFTLGDVSAAALVEEVVDTNAARAEQRGIRLSAGAPLAGATIRCDRDRILQVLGNLVDNALRFTPAGGRVTLHARDDAGGVRFEVEDTGPGVALDHLPHVFERYWTTGGGGTGLGLFIAHTIVAAHRGALEVLSEPGRGAHFSFTIPPALESAATDGAPPAREARWRLLRRRLRLLTAGGRPDRGVA